jgi:hypothetical protein
MFSQLEAKGYSKQLNLKSQWELERVSKYSQPLSFLTSISLLGRDRFKNSPNIKNNNHLIKNEF